MTEQQLKDKLFETLYSDYTGIIVNVEDALPFIREYVKQEAEQAWDAAIDYAREMMRNDSSPTPPPSKETYLLKYK